MTKLFPLRFRIGAVRELAKSIFEIAYVIFLPSKGMKPLGRREIEIALLPKKRGDRPVAPTCSSRSSNFWILV